jgi:hypothetical protein
MKHQVIEPPDVTSPDHPFSTLAKRRLPGRWLFSRKSLTQADAVRLWQRAKVRREAEERRRAALGRLI